MIVAISQRLALTGNFEVDNKCLFSWQPVSIVFWLNHDLVQPIVGRGNADALVAECVLHVKCKIESLQTWKIDAYAV